MVNVSKRTLKEKHFTELLGQLAKITAKSNHRTATAYLTELLTTSEQVMLAKRLAIILMLREQVANPVIAKTLRVSRTTVSKVFNEYFNGHFHTIGRLAGRTKAEKQELWSMVEKVLSLGMPPMAGPSRAPYLYKQARERRLKKRV